MPYITQQNGTISQSNSSTTALAGDAVFTGTGEEVLGFATASVFVYSDVASAANGLSIQWSTDNTNWDEADVYTIPAAITKVFTFGIHARYFRVVYTNGAGAQASFRLQTLLHNVLTKPSSHRLSDKLTTQNDAELVLEADAIVESRLTQGVIDFDTAGANTLISPTASQTGKLYRMVLGISPATTIRIRDNTTALTGPLNVTSLTLDFDGEPWFTTGTNSSLVLHLAANANVGGRVWYIKD